jgi:hypothetical protein
MEVVMVYGTRIVDWVEPAIIWIGKLVGGVFGA